MITRMIDAADLQIFLRSRPTAVWVPGMV